MAYGLVLMALALYKATVMWKNDGKYGGMTLVKVLIQDQIFYFFMYVDCLLTLSAILMIRNKGCALCGSGSHTFNDGSRHLAG